MTLEFLPEATAELFAAAEYYESKQAGLGWRFRNELLEVCRQIVQQPLLWRERAGEKVKGVSSYEHIFPLEVNETALRRRSG